MLTQLFCVSVDLYAVAQAISSSLGAVSVVHVQCWVSHSYHLLVVVLNGCAAPDLLLTITLALLMAVQQFSGRPK